MGAEEAAFSFADEAGTGSQACAGEGLAGSRGGAFMLDLGMEEIGGECSTSFCCVSVLPEDNTMSYMYPARVRI